MSYYEQRLSEDSDLLMQEVSRLANMVDQGLEDAVRALDTGNHSLAYRTILRDGPVNRLMETVEADCHRFIAKHLPSGAHLRFVSSTMRIALLLERMGDYAVTICRHSVQIQKPLQGTFKREVASMAADALQMFRQAMDAFRSRDESLARGTMGFAAQVDRDYVNALAMLREEDPGQVGVEDLFSRLVIIRQLERVSDQAKNLCEETVFALTGETKRRAPATILVVDEKDDALTHLVTALAEQQYPDKAAVTSAGRNPAGKLDPDALAFLLENGHEVKSRSPKALAEMAKPLSSFKALISLSGPPSDFVERIPFQTVALQWEVSDRSDLEKSNQELASQLGDLVDLLRGR
ncbi:MAG: phosphate transport system protein [Rhodothermales bacterium]|jgi:phosphate transport system protein